MIKHNRNRNGCVDVHAYLVENAVYDGEWELPRLRPEQQIPNRLIPFSKAISSTDTNAWVHFFEDDVKIERLWHNPKRYTTILQRFNGVISPDFSIYRDMPLVMQYWNMYRNRALANWLQKNGVPVIANVRFGDDRTYAAACAGVPRHSVIALGSHGCIKVKTERAWFKAGLEYILQTLQPTDIIVYGTAPEDVFGICHDMGIRIHQFDSDIMQAMGRRKAVQ